MYSKTNINAGSFYGVRITLLKKDIDPLMQWFHDTDPVFYNVYFAARLTRSLGVRHGKTANPSAPASTDGGNGAASAPDDKTAAAGESKANGVPAAEGATSDLVK